MSLLALISGLINLSSQAVYQKVVSMIAGDLYSTFLAVTLTFIFGSAVGSYFGSRLRSHLPWIELLSGLYALTLRWLIDQPMAQTSQPLWFVILGLLVPAFALGTHIPLYSYYLKQIRFGWVYALYHFGAVVGLFVFEAHFSQAGSTKGALALVGMLQVGLGLILLFIQRQGLFHLSEPLQKKWPAWQKTLPVVVGSTLSFYFLFWSLKTQIMLTEGYRLHATCISAAVLFWMSLAGVTQKKWNKTSTSQLLLWQAGLLTLMYAAFPWIYPKLASSFNGSIIQYFSISFLLALLLTPYIYLSSLIFIKATQGLVSDGWDVDSASGALGVFAALANIVGMVIASLMSAELWYPPFFFVPLMAMLTAFVLLYFKIRIQYAGVSVLLLLVSLGLGFIQPPQAASLFETRVHPSDRQNYQTDRIKIFSSPFSTIALFSIVEKPAENLKRTAQERFYIVDGHVSHNIYMGMEYKIGLIAAHYRKEPFQKSLVIGLGSGQAAWSVAATSMHTDIVEISPAAISNLNALSVHNFNMSQDSNYTIHLRDGLDFVKNCNPGTYDLIFNTATYPANFNAAKVYSAEFVNDVKRCLKTDGIYQTYFDGNTVNTVDEVYQFLAPIHQSFPSVDITLDPYPSVIASVSPRTMHSLSSKQFVDGRKWKLLKDNFEEEFEKTCNRILRDVQPPKSHHYPVSTLDRPWLEALSLKNGIAALRPDIEFPPVEEYFQSEGNWATVGCE